MRHLRIINNLRYALREYVQEGWIRKCTHYSQNPVEKRGEECHLKLPASQLLISRKYHINIEVS